MTYAAQTGVSYGAIGSSAASPAVWGQPVRHPCHMNRSELEKLLERSDYGKNERMYACYFLPKDGTGSGAPLCLTCGLPIGSHSNPPPATTSIFMPTLEPRSTPPRGFALRADGTTYELTSNTPLKGLLFAGGCNILIATALLLTFGLTGLIAKAPVVIIGPCICTVVGFLVCFFVKRTAITISTLTQEVDVTERRVVWPCCVRRNHFSFADVLVDQITAAGSNVLINGVPYSNVALTINAPQKKDGTVTVNTHFVPFLEAEEVAAEWRAFFAFYSRK